MNLRHEANKKEKQQKIAQSSVEGGVAAKRLALVGRSWVVEESAGGGGQRRNTAKARQWGGGRETERKNRRFGRKIGQFACE